MQSCTETEHVLQLKCVFFTCYGSLILYILLSLSMFDNTAINAKLNIVTILINVVLSSK